MGQVWRAPKCSNRQNSDCHAHRHEHGNRVYPITGDWAELLFRAVEEVFEEDEVVLILLGSLRLGGHQRHYALALGREIDILVDSPRPRRIISKRISCMSLESRRLESRHLDRAGFHHVGLSSCGHKPFGV